MGNFRPGCRGHTFTLFERHPRILNDHRKAGPRFNVSSEGPHNYTGVLGTTQTCLFVCLIISSIIITSGVQNPVCGKCPYCFNILSL